MKTLAIDPERLWSTLMASADIGIAEQRGFGGLELDRGLAELVSSTARQLAGRATA